MLRETGVFKFKSFKRKLKTVLKNPKSEAKRVSWIFLVRPIWFGLVSFMDTRTKSSLTS